MITRVMLIMASTVLFTAHVSLAPTRAEAGSPVADATPATRMVIVKGKDVTGEVIKRLGLPNQNYCWEQCVQEARCTGTRWGVVSGMTAGQCQLMTGALAFGEPHEIKTQDGQRIVVVASRKEANDAKSTKVPSGT